MKPIPFCCHSLGAALLLGLALTVPPITVSGSQIKYHFQAWIDGSDQLVIHGSSLQWNHYDWAAVGRHEGHNEPTIISSWLNGAMVMDSVRWIPEWPEPPPEEIRYRADSSVFTSLSPELPRTAMTVTLTPIRARGNVHVSQYPSLENDYTLKLFFNDNDLSAPDWYEVEVTLETPSASVIAVSPAELSFGEELVELGTSATEPIEISNSGDAGLTVYALTLTGPNAAEFVLDQAVPFTLAPGENQTITITFTPLSSGEKNAILNINHNAQSPNPLSVAVTGKGGVSAEGLIALLDNLRAIGEIRSQGFLKSLLAKAYAFEQQQAYGNYDAAQGILRALENETKAQSGKKLTVRAGTLISSYVDALLKQM